FYSGLALLYSYQELSKNLLVFIWINICEILCYIYPKIVPTLSCLVLAECVKKICRTASKISVEKNTMKAIRYFNNSMKLLNDQFAVMLSVITLSSFYTLSILTAALLNFIGIYPGKKYTFHGMMFLATSCIQNLIVVFILGKSGDQVEEAVAVLRSWAAQEAVKECPAKVKKDGTCSCVMRIEEANNVCGHLNVFSHFSINTRSVLAFLGTL